MPLKRGKSRKVVQENIRELVRSYERTGRIGKSRPKSKREAVRQAAAIAYEAAGKRRKKSRKS